MIPDRSAPSRVRSAASRPGLLRTDLKGGATLGREMFPQLSPPSGQGATYRRCLYRSECRGCGELFFHERAPGGVRIIRAVLIAVLLGVVGFLARADQHPERQVVVQALRDTENADDSLRPHLSPLGWEHMNLTGDYNWRPNKQVEQGDFRPLPPLKARSATSIWTTTSTSSFSDSTDAAHAAAASCSIALFSRPWRSKLLQDGVFNNER